MPPKSWPRIPSPPFTSLKPRPLHPFGPPPAHLLQNPATLPVSSRPPLNIPYTASTHIVPSAHYRSSPSVPLPRIPQCETKEERKKAVAKVQDELLKVRLDAWDGKFGDGCEQLLFNCIRRYVRNDLLEGQSQENSGVTLLFAHANGFPKETWEPTIQHLLSSTINSRTVDEVWVWESIQHGDSALINAQSLSAVFNWTDNARDLLTFLLYYLPTNSGGSLPSHLEQVSSAEVESRKTHGFSQRMFVPVGHSYGGCTSVLAALTHPALFSSIILVDPVIVQPGRYSITDGRMSGALFRGAVQRRDEWPTWDAALEALEANPFFSRWDPEVLKTYWKCGLYSETDNGPVRLKMSGILEATIFLDTLTSNEVYQRFADLDERIELRFIMPGREGEPEIGGPGHGQILSWRRPNNSSNVRISTAGHLIAQEAPRELAAEIGAFLDKKYGIKKSNL